MADAISDLLQQYYGTPDSLGGNVQPRAPRSEPYDMYGEDVRPQQLGQHNLIPRAASAIAQPMADAVLAGIRGQASPQQVAWDVLTNGSTGPIGMARAPRYIRAYHGSPHDFDEFATPSFFSAHEGIARQYRREGGGGDNLNGLGGRFDPPEGFYRANSAMDEAEGNRDRALQMLQERINRFSTPVASDYLPRTWLGALLGRPARLRDPQTLAMLRAHHQSGLDYLQSGADLGRMYEVRLPRPSAHYDGDQAADIANAIANGHRVITWGSRIGGSGEIIALDPSVIKILRKYGIAAPVAGVTTADILSQYGSDQNQP